MGTRKKLERTTNYLPTLIDDAVKRLKTAKVGGEIWMCKECDDEQNIKTK